MIYVVLDKPGNGMLYPNFLGVSSDLLDEQNFRGPGEHQPETIEGWGTGSPVRLCNRCVCRENQLELFLGAEK